MTRVRLKRNVMRSRYGPDVEVEYCQFLFKMNKKGGENTPRFGPVDVSNDRVPSMSCHVVRQMSTS